MAIQKLEVTLSIKSLKVEFPIARIKRADSVEIYNALQNAIDDGILAERLQASADKYLGGNLSMAVKAMKACVSSYKVNYRKTTTPMDMELEGIRIDTLSDWLSSYDNNLGARKVTIAINTGTDRTNKAKWDITEEEIEANHHLCRQTG